MSTPTPGWQPFNDTERRLLDAVLAGDVAVAMGIIASVPLFLPGFSEDDAGLVHTRQRLVSSAREDGPYLLVFTSPETLHGAVPADGWRVTSLTELSRGTPVGWGLAINPTTPTCVLIAPERVHSLVPAPEDLNHFVPADDGEGLLRDAMLALDSAVLLDVLVTRRVVVVTRALEIDGVVAIAVFTSRRRFEEFRTDLDLDLPTEDADLVDVLRRWPDPGVRLAVNPGSPIAFGLGGEKLPGLLAHAARLAAGRERAEGPQAPVIAPAVLPLPAPGAPPVEPPPQPQGSVADLLRGAG
jgi:hypothetical protein